MGFIIGLTKDSFIQIRTYYMSNGYLKRRWVWHDDSSLQLASCRPSTDLLQLPHPLHLGNFKNSSFGFEQKTRFHSIQTKNITSQKGDNLDFLKSTKNGSSSEKTKTNFEAVTFLNFLLKPKTSHGYQITKTKMASNGSKGIPTRPAKWHQATWTITSLSIGSL